MPQFDAQSIVEPLRCRLLPFADFDGVIPEPSDIQVGVFLAGLKRVLTAANEKLGQAKEIDVTDREQMMAAIEALEPDDFVQVADEMAALHAALCGEELGPDGTVTVPGKPSKAQILSVPLRRRNAFYNWLQTEVLNPEAGTGAGNGQANHLLPAAAGSSSTSPAAT